MFKKIDPKGYYVQIGLLDNKYRPVEPLRSKETGLKGQYVQKRPVQRASTFKKDY
jgi:hypothetical protein